jgi:hypothetical protein
MFAEPLLRRREDQRVLASRSAQRSCETTNSLVIFLLVARVAELADSLELGQEMISIGDRVTRDASQRMGGEISLASIVRGEREQQLPTAPGVPLVNRTDRTGRDRHLMMARNATEQNEIYVLTGRDVRGLAGA